MAILLDSWAFWPGGLLRIPQYPPSLSLPPTLGENRSPALAARCTLITLVCSVPCLVSTNTACTGEISHHTTAD